MSKHSFAPKLTADEYLNLTMFGQAGWTPLTAGMTGITHLSHRGLLMHKREFDLRSNHQADLFMLTRRGALMRQRYQKQETDRRFREELKAG